MDILKKFFTTPNGEEEDEDDQNGLKTILVSNPINLSPYALLSAEKIPEEADQDEIRRRKRLALQVMIGKNDHEIIFLAKSLRFVKARKIRKI